MLLARNSRLPAARPISARRLLFRRQRGLRNGAPASRSRGASQFSGADRRRSRERRLRIHSLVAARLCLSLCPKRLPLAARFRAGSPYRAAPILLAEGSRLEPQTIAPALAATWAGASGPGRRDRYEQGAGKRPKTVGNSFAFACGARPTTLRRRSDTFAHARPSHVLLT